MITQRKGAKTQRKKFKDNQHKNLCVFASLR